MYLTNINRSRSRFCSFLIKFISFEAVLTSQLYYMNLEYIKEPIQYQISEKKISPRLGLEPTKMISFLQCIIFERISYSEFPLVCLFCAPHLLGYQAMNEEPLWILCALDWGQNRKDYYPLGPEGILQNCIFSSDLWWFYTKKSARIV